MLICYTLYDWEIYLQSRLNYFLVLNVEKEVYHTNIEVLDVFAKLEILGICLFKI